MNAGRFSVSLGICLSIVGLVSNASAGTGDDAIQNELAKVSNHYVVVVPGSGSTTVARVQTREDFMASYGGRTPNEAATKAGTGIKGDGGEDIIPTPEPPFPGNNFQPGDRVTHHCTSGAWTRITTYVRGEAGPAGNDSAWWIEMNSLTHANGTKER